MKMMQEENIQPLEHRIERTIRVDIISCLFFMLGMFICAYLLHHFIL
ncbi:MULTISPECIES: hypothetical protein [unclassified Acinetobacter]|nr:MULTISPECIES: hypothetical protein [unclassified Acinetobacter]WOE31559.1 hypothetical protein QSG84_14835 [Acinetobacter sp. SAAs470]WOE39756.1 hypothetical protein QSG86_08500 [Acinetobacter sp. SAAs474]